jgi:hypothetical protein
MATFENFLDQILQHQMDDGAMMMGQAQPGKYTVSPYFANLCLIDVMTANSWLSFDTDQKFLGCAKAWIKWYIAKASNLQESPDNIIHDYIGTAYNWQIDNITLKPPYYDSVDSYIATFLTLVGIVYPLTAQDPDWRREVDAFLPLAWSVLSKTFVNATAVQGLTMNIPSNGTFYTEDNFEVIDTLNSATNYPGGTGAISNPAATASQILLSLRKHISQPDAPFWHYNRDISPSGIIETANPLNGYYPDQQIQLMAIALAEFDDVHKTLYMNMKQPSLNLPAIANTDPDTELLNLDQVAWWGLAAISAGDFGPNSMFEVVTARLAAYNLPLIPWIHTLGHAALVLAAEIASSLPPHPIHGPPFPPPHPHHKIRR